MTDEIDKKFEKLLKKRKEKISKADKISQKAEQEKREIYQKEVKKFKEVYSDFKKIFEKFGKFKERTDYHLPNMSVEEKKIWKHQYLSKPDISHTSYQIDLGIIKEVKLFDTYLEMKTENKEAFKEYRRDYKFRVNIDKDCFRVEKHTSEEHDIGLESTVWEDAVSGGGGKNVESDIKTSFKDEEIEFKSKEKLIEFLFNLIAENLTDKEVKKYFK